MKKFIAVSLILVTIVGLSYFFSAKDPVGAAQTGIYMDTNGTSNSTATSTATYMTSSTATTTLSFDPTNSDVIQVGLAVYSTSTAGVVNVGVDFSNNGTDWYPYETGTAAYPKTLNAGAVGDIWTFTASTSTANETVFKSFTLAKDFAAKYARLRYANSGGAATVHVEVSQKKGF